jgi:hypothetical protein
MFKGKSTGGDSLYCNCKVNFADKNSLDCTNKNRVVQVNIVNRNKVRLWVGMIGFYQSWNSQSNPIDLKSNR